MYCRGCLYDLRHLDRHRCPECGRLFDPADPTTFLAQLPVFWLRRLARALAIIAVGVAVSWVVVITRPLELPAARISVPMPPDAPALRLTLGAFVGVALGAFVLLPAFWTVADLLGSLKSTAAQPRLRRLLLSAGLAITALCVLGVLVGLADIRGTRAVQAVCDRYVAILRTHKVPANVIAQSVAGSDGALYQHIQPLPPAEQRLILEAKDVYHPGTWDAQTESVFRAFGFGCLGAWCACGTRFGLWLWPRLKRPIRAVTGSAGS